MKRFLVFAVGAGATALAVTAVRRYVTEGGPALERAQDFVGRVRAAMAERETELRRELGMD